MSSEAPSTISGAGERQHQEQVDRCPRPGTGSGTRAIATNVPRMVAITVAIGGDLEAQPQRVDEGRVLERVQPVVEREPLPDHVELPDGLVEAERRRSRRSGGRGRAGRSRHRRSGRSRRAGACRGVAANPARMASWCSGGASVASEALTPGPRCRGPGRRSITDDHDDGHEHERQRRGDRVVACTRNWFWTTLPIIGGLRAAEVLRVHEVAGGGDEHQQAPGEHAGQREREARPCGTHARCCEYRSRAASIRRRSIFSRLT